ncbi:hypothetical protein M434DRAFT_220787 [Hypoxylon sp. CO27-5]|nr:hypothetical protein M434DRAFT_220787 [Hypoxylon sp. CO27-5]
MPLTDPELSLTLSFSRNRPGSVSWSWSCSYLLSFLSPSTPCEGTESHKRIASLVSMSAGYGGLTVVGNRRTSFILRCFLRLKPLRHR